MIFKGLYEEKKEKKGWYIKLTDVDSYGFYCAAVEEDGSLLGNLFCMDTETGALNRMVNVPKELGFDLDKQNRIKVKE